MHEEFVGNDCVPFEAEEIKTARDREIEGRNRGKESRREGQEKRASERASERGVVEAEKDLEPWKAPITVARVRLPSETRFIPQLLRASIRVRVRILNVTDTPKRLAPSSPSQRSRLRDPALLIESISDIINTTFD